MSADVVLNINATFGARAAKEATGLENKVKASMRAVIRENWMATRDEELFRAGVGGALIDVGLDSEDGQRLERSILALKKFSAMLTAAQAGLSVNIESVLPGEGEEQPLPLMGWWHQVRAEK
jgi:hypothetical protein